MVGKPIAWSASRVKNFKQCPKKLYHMAIAPRGSPDKVEYVQGSAGKKGEDLHKAMEKRLQGVPLPLNYSYLEPIAQKVESWQGQTVCEAQMALDTELQPCGTKDWDRVYVRATPDLLSFLPPDYRTVVQIDYKTGNPLYDDSYQLDLNAAILFNTHAHIDRVVSSYAWFKINTISKPIVWERHQLDELWGKVLEEPSQIQRAAAMNAWPAKPGKHCGWCDVNRARKCEYATEKFQG